LGFLKKIDKRQKSEKAKTKKPARASSCGLFRFLMGLPFGKTHFWISTAF